MGIAVFEPKLRLSCVQMNIWIQMFRSEQNFYLHSIKWLEINNDNKI